MKNPIQVTQQRQITGSTVVESLIPWWKHREALCLVCFIHMHPNRTIALSICINLTKLKTVQGMKPKGLVQSSAPIIYLKYKI